MAIFHSFIHLMFIGIIALFPVVNPVGSAFMVNPYLSNLNKADKKKAVKRITLYAFSICTVSLFAGHYILELFGISIPVIQLAGGIMICKMGWDFLSDKNKSEDSGNDETSPVNVSEFKQLEDKLFYPITFPVTTGAGTMSVLFTLSAHSSANDFKSYSFNTGAILLAIIVMCILVYVFYLNTKRIIRHLGGSGEKIVNRITSFLIFCVGLQIAVSGIIALVQNYKG